MSDVFRKEYSPLSEEQKVWMALFKGDASKLYACFDDSLNGLPELDKRMMALAKTNLEQSIMWAIKAIT